LQHFIVLQTTFALVRRIACLADNQKTTLLFTRINIVGMVGSRGRGSKFIVASIRQHALILHAQTAFDITGFVAFPEQAFLRFSGGFDH
jgi:hypothetical protein